MSNLYANRVFGEHPVALWSFDEEAHYISQINETNRNISAWTKTNCTVSAIQNTLNTTPFPDSGLYSTIPVNYTTLSEISMQSSLLTLQRGTEPLYSSFYIYLNYASIEYIDFGSTDGVGNYSLQRNYLPTSGENFWAYVACNDIVYDYLYIKIKFVSTNIPERVTYLINGLAVGDYAESFASRSLGINLSSLSGSDLVTKNSFITDNDDNISGYSALSVGSKEKQLYYLAEDNFLLAQNTSIPIAFGSNYLTTLKPSSNPEIPSLVFDGDGFLCDNGKYDTYTFEFWLKISDTSTTSKRIFGPLGNKKGSATEQSLDGLWIKNTVLTFIVGNKAILSYNVGIFSEPMLIHLIYTKDTASIMINGDIVATQYIGNLDLIFAETDNTWLGFWSYDTLGSLEIDCMSLFGYSINELLARRRFIWGQGVNDLGVINESFNGKAIVSDFATSKLSSNISYPNNYIWDAGTFDNLRVVNNRIQPQDLKLPEVYLSGYSKDLWLNSIVINNEEPYFTFRPTGNNIFDTENCYVEFNRLGDYVQNPLGIVITWSNQNINNSLYTWDEFSSYYSSYTWSAFDYSMAYSINTYDGSPQIYVNDEPIFIVKHPQFLNREIKAYLYSGLKIKVVYIESGNEIEIYSEDFDDTKKYSTFFNLTNTLSESNVNIPNGMREMLLNTNELQVIVGSDNVNVFSGKIFSVGIVSSQNYLNTIRSKLSETSKCIFNTTRISNDQYTVFDLCSYSWLPKNDYGFLYDDIGIKGYWQDYVSLEQMASLVTDAFGKEKLSVDNIQFNIGVSTVKEQNLYSYLNSKYATYAQLNAAFSKYSELKANGLREENKNSLDDEPVYYKTDSSFIQSYVSFQKNNKKIKQKNELQLANAVNSDAIFVQKEPDFLNKYFEVVDGSVLVPPKNIKPENIIMSTYLEFSVPGIKTFPVNLRNMEFSSFAKNQNSLTPIGTKYGKDIYPVINGGAYYDYYSPNPFKVNKKSLPYFFLGKESGFISKANRYEDWDSGFQISLNEVKNNSNFLFDNIQVWCRRNEPFSLEEKNVFSFEYGNSKKIFKLKAYANNPNRGIINVYNADGTPDIAVTFYQNGNAVYRPIFNINEWTSIQAIFPAGGLDTGSQVPQIKLLQGLVFNNISYFPVKQVLGSLSFSYRTWLQILQNEIPEQYIWSDWKDALVGEKKYTWQNVLIKGTSTSKTRELSEIIYQTYIGTQYITFDGKMPLRLNQDEIASYRETQWSSNIVIPT